MRCVVCPIPKNPIKHSYLRSDELYAVDHDATWPRLCHAIRILVAVLAHYLLMSFLSTGQGDAESERTARFSVAS